MTVKIFIETMQNYYSMNYGEMPGKVIANYLATWREDELDQLAGMTIKTFSGRFKTLPDVAVFEELRGQVRDTLKYKPVAEVLQLTDQSEMATPEEVAALRVMLAMWGYD